jgi:microcin C transport system permease protein
MAASPAAASPGLSWFERHLNPVARQRWRRFKRLRRGYWSFWLLTGLFVLSLFAELLANDKPLYVRFNGRSLFPLLRFHPEHEFLGNGNYNRPNYRKVNRTPQFRANPGNLMIFAPVPYGPDETIEADDVQLPPEVALSVTPAPRVATLDVRADNTIAVAVGCDLFLGQADQALQDQPLATVWRAPPELTAALAARFANQAAPELQLVVPLGGRLVQLRLPAFTPEGTPRKKLRVSLVEQAEAAAAWQVTFDERLQPVRGQRGAWSQLSADSRRQLLDRARQRLTGAVPDIEMVLDGRNTAVAITKEDFVKPLRPVPGHWLGLDSAGHDVLVWVIYAFRTSMLFGLLLVLASKVLGVVIGALQGYFGGLLDLSVQRFTEIWGALPFLYIMILIGSIYGRSFFILLFIYTIFEWIGISYYLRAEFLRLRKQPFVEAARVTGLPTRRVMFSHIFPNALTPLITFVPFSLVGAIGTLSALDYLGFGLPALTPSWGTLLANAQDYRDAWWLTLYPSLALFVTMLLGVFIGEGVRAAFDPKKFSHLE